MMLPDKEMHVMMGATIYMWIAAVTFLVLFNLGLIPEGQVWYTALLLHFSGTAAVTGAQLSREYTSNGDSFKWPWESWKDTLYTEIVPFAASLGLLAYYFNII